MKRLSVLFRGTRGHPLHPPFTDATIGAFAVALVLGVLGAAGVTESRTSAGWWLALVAGLGLTIPTALTGLVDWLSITRSTPLWDLSALKAASPGDVQEDESKAA
jgi:uncharacterized membrane protein